MLHNINDIKNVPAFVKPETPADCSLQFGWTMEFAMRAHGTQTYDKGAPYIVHLIGGSNVLNRFGFRVDDLDFGFYTHQTILLHDTLEDTDVKYATLLHLFGLDVAEAVFAITDIHPVRNRAEANMRTWPGIRNNPIALPCKLADRIFNLETSTANQSRQLQRYVQEYKDFKLALHNGKYTPMWDHLDALVAHAHTKVQQG